MGRTKGAVNKEQKRPDAFGLSTEQRIELLANIIVDILMEEELANEELCTTD